MKKLFLFFLFITTHFAFAQDYSIKGRVIEKQSDGLPSASVVLLQPEDSSVVTHTTTNNRGFFNLKEVEKGNY